MFCGVTPIRALSSWTCAPSGYEVIANSPIVGVAGTVVLATATAFGRFAARSSSGSETSSAGSDGAGGGVAACSAWVGGAGCSCGTAWVVVGCFDAETLIQIAASETTTSTATAT